MNNRPCNVLILAETVNGVPAPISLELLGISRQLVAENGGAVCAATLSSCKPDVPELLITMGADRVFVLKQPMHDAYYESDVWLEGLEGLINIDQYGIILAGHTTLGADLAPRLAFGLKSAVATACEKIELTDDNRLRITRPCYGNKAREVLLLNTTPSIATIRAKMYEPLEPDATRRGVVTSVEITSSDTTHTKVIERKRECSTGSANLESASIIVAGGRGLGSSEGFTMLQNLASILGGAVGASRVACDLGWCPHSWQIGLTGKTVTPELYVAVGISGASHHMAGCGNSKVIVAINSDPEAAIFKEARFGIVGDYREVIPALVQEIAGHQSAIAQS